MPAMLDVSPEFAPVQGILVGALERIEARFDEQLQSDLLPVQDMVEHVESYRGKMVRPMLVVLCALGATGEEPDEDGSQVSDAHVTVAAVCEMIHMATLVHDDVLDEAETRRGGETVNRLWGNELAVILGDYLFSAAYHLCSRLDSQSTALLIGGTGMTLCAGELLQLHHRENYSIDEATYTEVIRRKTASLIATACRLGAQHSGADAKTLDAWESFGTDLGMAFQIQDDLLDLMGEAEVVGKPVRRDVALGKLTLPLIHHLAEAAPEARTGTIEAIRSGDATLADLAARLATTGSIEYAQGVALSHVERAKATLAPMARTSPVRMLEMLADAVVTRRF